MYATEAHHHVKEQPLGFFYNLFLNGTAKDTILVGQYSS